MRFIVNLLSVSKESPNVRKGLGDFFLSQGMDAGSWR